MRTTTRLRKPFFSSTWPTWSALTVGLALSAAGQAHAQVAPSDAPPTLVAQADAPPTKVAQATPAPAPVAPTPTPPDTAAPAPAPAAPPQPVVEGNPLAEQQLEQVRQMVSGMPKLIEPNGYIRAGIGVNSKGGKQEAFQAPGAYAKYRLGNEPDLYGEFGFTFNWVNPDHKDGAWFKTALKLAFSTPRNSSFDQLDIPNKGNIAIREAYAQGGHVIEAKPEMSFWAGQRFYRRKDVHIIDFFFHDMSGYGA